MSDFVARKYRERDAAARRNGRESAEKPTANKARRESDSPAKRRGWPRFPLPIPASQLAADSGGKPDWILQGYLARGSVMLFTAFWKSGKSTWLAHLMQALQTGQDFLGQPTQETRVITLSEEGQGLWAQRRDRLSIGDHALFLCRPFFRKPNPPEWLEFVEHLAALVKTEALGLVILDTVMAFLPTDDENDAAKMLTGLHPLHALTEAGAAVLLTHHPKKGDASEGQASRGSGALPGFVDVITEMRRASPGDWHNRQRVLTSYSRFEATPAELVIELAEDGKSYSALGCRADVDREQRIETIREALPAGAPGWTVEELLENWPETVRRPGRSTLAQELAAGAGQHWSSSGQGRRGSPLRYYRNSFLPAPPPRGEPWKKGNGEAPAEREPGEKG